MPITYGQVAGIKHPPNAPTACQAETQTVEADAGGTAACPSCGLQEKKSKIKDGMCRECRYEAGLPIHARNMRRALRKTGRAMKEVAVAVGLKPSVLSNYMTGRTSPPLPTFARICREIGVTPNDVLGFGEGEE